MSSEMTELTVVDRQGKKTGTISVRSDVFAAPILPHLIHQAVRLFRNAARAGTHAVKTRAAVSGGGRKPWKQKGTGRARAGSSRSPLWVGGGVAHGPKPRSYDFRMNKKERRRAMTSALSARVTAGRLIVLDDFGLNEIKTNAAAEVLRALGVSRGEKALVICDTTNQVLTKSLRNLEGVEIASPTGISVYGIMKARHLVVLKETLEPIQERLAN